MSVTKSRHRKEKWFRRMGLFSLLLALVFLGSIFGDIIYKGYPAFLRTEIAIEAQRPDLLNPHAIYQSPEGIKWVTASDEVDMYNKHEHPGKLSPEQIQAFKALKKVGIMSLPVNVVATRAALSSVPETLKEAALGLGATPLQVLFHHVVPMALPGIMTGVILSVARALGETAPLLMLGMVAFIGTPPSS